MIQNLVLLIHNVGFHLKPVCVFYTCNIIYVLCWFQTYAFYGSIKGSPWDFWTSTMKRIQDSNVGWPTVVPKSGL